MFKVKSTQLPLYLQLFNGTGGENGGGEQDPKTYTEEELQAKLQAETDKRVTEALKTNQAKWEEDFKKKLELEKQEAARLAKLTAEEQEREKLKKEREDLEKLIIKHQRDALELETVKQLAEKKLPTQFASFLITENDAAKVKAHIETFEKTFQEAVQGAVDERMKGKAPSAPGENKGESGPVTYSSALKEYYKR